MGVIRRFIKLSTYTGVASVGAFFYATRKNVEEPLPLTDHIFSSSHFKTFNPNNNPTTHDFFVRRIPLSDIKPDLLENKGKLTEAFCAGVWSGLGYAAQRAHHARNAPADETKDHLWSRSELRSSTYEPGTLITDHFQVLEKTPERIIVRCGDSPRVTGVRPSDGLFEMSAVVKPEQGVAEFGLKSCFYQGLGKAESEPMPSHIVWLHKQYTKLWLETAVHNCTR
ncbi:hypothetical protein ASPWEDRAFT_45592 [Aspergillus wentii DTO 134E9]|uniref:Uncharacterized protein n=1 Tax=Aspergillus wentii DTO 134E9 TaxID=1073089 RepID=A0A1L9R9M0_ASPWE|nr:uncharacterized protein ASPWEDRAFT_45592 [Aspergillus wentii DTO 134E9]KAI9926343.1 hypothetical protein MW887_004107 [Aspergillus wentii]OJJ31625.1 hypothetical protein ASPWEDRAFT_45592 [Aspergillus wentii DTO 134E9]